MNRKETAYQNFITKQQSLSDVIRFGMAVNPTGNYLLFAAVTLLHIGISMCLPYLTRVLTSDVLQKRNVSLLWGIAFAMLFSSLMAQILLATKSLISTRMMMTSHQTVERGVMERVLSLPLSVVSAYAPGDFKLRMDGICNISDVFLKNVVLGGITLLTSLSYLFQVRMFAQPLLVPAMILIFLNLLLSSATVIVRRNLDRRILALDAKKSGMELDLLQGVVKIKQTGAEKRVYHRWESAYDAVADATYRPPAFLQMSPALLSAVKLFGTVGLYALAEKNHIRVSDYLAFSVACGGLFASVSSLTELFLELADLSPQYELARPILDTEIRREEEKQSPEKVTGEIRVFHLSFRYEPEGRDVLKNVSFQIKPGEKIGITGATGCGKTTLIRLLLGLYPCTKGTITYDEKSIDELNLKQLRQNIGCVMQDGRLYAADIFSNLAFAAPDLTEEEADRALSMAKLKEEVDRDPLGLYAQVYENSEGISGGQKQRLLIAAAIAKRPKILILDEATSALDVSLEREVMESLSSLSCTQIIVAHRKTALKTCDRIFSISEGKLIEVTGKTG